MAPQAVSVTLDSPRGTSGSRPRRRASASAACCARTIAAIAANGSGSPPGGGGAASGRGGGWGRVGDLVGARARRVQARKELGEGGGRPPRRAHREYGKARGDDDRG